MTVRILQGDCREVLATLPSESVNCCVTSPPYFGLRDYGTGTWDGGDPTCKHEAPPKGGRNPETAGKQLTNGGTLQYQFVGVCGVCGARRTDAQIGLEESPQEFVAALVAVFDEVRRVLRSDGTCWLNIGDSYAGSWGAQSRAQGPTGEMADRSVISARQIRAHPRFEGKTGTVGAEWGLKPKDLMLVPFRLALALQAAGWWVRQDIIWHKPNPMPESILDRCTKAHEYLFLLAKSERYHYDAAAIAEPAINAGRTVIYDGEQKNCETKDDPRFATRIASDRTVGDTRNKRSVWTIATRSFPEAHFATFPPDLIEPCILAGCPVGGLVLDPFGGAGTTGLVADRHGRNAILIELNPEYADMAERRIHNDAPLFADVAQR